MKRFLHSVLAFLVLMACSVLIPSCRSSKKADRAFFDAQIEALGKTRTVFDGVKISKSRKKIVEEAYAWLGTPYAYGHSEKGIACDCSGMVMCVYETVTGIKLPRNSAKQLDFCSSIKHKDVRVGDLCFFATGRDPDKVSHVGIMIDDRNFIHASSSKGVVVSDITQPYWIKTFMAYGRVPDK